MYIYIYIYHTHIDNIYIYIYAFVYIYIYIYIVGPRALRDVGRFPGVVFAVALVSLLFLCLMFSLVYSLYDLYLSSLFVSGKLPKESYSMDDDLQRQVQVAEGALLLPQHLARQGTAVERLLVTDRWGQH